MLRRFAVLSALVFCLVPLSARFNPAFASPYTLTASGVWQSNDGLFNGTWQAHFDVAGYDLSGTMNLIGMPGIAEGNLAGTWDLQDIGFGIMFVDEELISFDGALQGLELVGNFDTGDVSGIWSGLLTEVRLTTEPLIPIFDDTIPTLLLGHNSGSAGDIVTLVAKLHTVGQAIERIENVLSFDPMTTPILSRSNGQPNCTVNPIVGTANALFQFLPEGCSGNGCNQVRAVVDSLSNLGSLLDSAAVFTCKVRIGDGTAAGIYNIVASALEAFDEDDLLIEFASVIGQISVKAKEASKKLFGCDCSIMPTSPSVPLSSLLAPLAVLLVRQVHVLRKRGRGSKR
jgi:hypothetical protein